MLGLDLLEPDVGADQLTGMKATGRHGEPDLGRVERDRERGVDGRPAADLPCGCVDTRRKIHGDDWHARVVHPLDQRGGLGPRLAAEAGAEEGIHDHVRLLDGVRLDCIPLRLAQHAGGDAAVAAVRAAAADDREPACVGKPLQRVLRDRRPCALHQLWGSLRIARVALLRLAHLRRGVER
jgi:hypothetical protein